MDIEQEKQKADYIHKLEMRKMYIEKLLLGVLIAVAGFLANLYYEHYRSQLEQDRFLHEKKIAAVNNIRDAYSLMQGVFMKYTREEELKRLPKNCQEKYDNAIQEFCDAVNRESVMLSADFSRESGLFLWVHDGLYRRELARSVVYREFAVDLQDLYEELCKMEVGTLAKMPDRAFHLEPMSWSEAEKMSREKYLEKQFKNWQEWKKQKRDITTHEPA